MTRADLLLVGHPHHDHVADTVRVSQQTGAKAAIAEIGADYLLSQGLPAAQIHRVTGRGEGEVLDYNDFTVRVLHGFHLDIGLAPEQAAKWQALPASPGRLRGGLLRRPDQRGGRRGGGHRRRAAVHTPEVITEATLDLHHRHRRLHASPTETAAARSAMRNAGVRRRARRGGRGHPSINGLPHVAQQLEDVFLPLVELYQPKILIPSHHDELWTNFDGAGLRKLFADVSTELLKERVHDELRETITAQPGLIEPVTIGRAKGDVT